MAELNLKGMEEIQHKLIAMQRKGVLLENRAVRAAAKVYQQEIEENAPRSSSPRQPNSKTQKWRTGQHAADNVRVTSVKVIDGVKTVQVGFPKTDNSPFFYMKFFEWGTSKMSAQPFMEPAFNRKKQAAEEAMKQVLLRGLGL